jgi:hypothetical protein
MSDDIEDSFSKLMEGAPGDLAGGQEASEEADLGEWDAGEDDEDIEPREWLYGNLFCRTFMSGLMGEGGAGKTALRYLQFLSMATGRSFTGEHVFQRSRVLLVGLEDDRKEMRRRIKAAMLHHGIARDELKGWLFYATPRGVTLADLKDGSPVAGKLEAMIRRSIERRRIDVVNFDPFIKTHTMEENSNTAIDFVVRLLTSLAIELNVATDSCHHTKKGTVEAGSADAGRGASAFKDGGRLMYTVTRMTTNEAKLFGIGERERPLYVRHDSAKVNLAPPSGDTRWFKLVGVSLGNKREKYPHGDIVQTVEPWTPPDLWEGLSRFKLNEILTAIDRGLPDGRKYSAHSRATDTAAWRVVQEHAPEKTEEQAKEIIKAWVKNQVLVPQPYHDPVAHRDGVMGLVLDQSKRPS